MSTEGRAAPTSPGPSTSRASIADVARLAGVAPITVSRVANGAESVSPATRQRVQSAMDKLGYAPNHAARALRSGSFGAIGLVAHRLARTGESRTVEGVVEAARAEGYTVSLVDVVAPTSDEVTAAARRLSHQAIDGLIIIRAETSTPATLALPPRLPVVVSDSSLIRRHAAVSSDQVSGTRAAVQHLLDLGHPTVHHLSGPADSSPAQVRLETWRETLRAAGRTVPEPWRGDWTLQSGYELGARIAADPQVTAVFCANDEMAAGLMRSLHEHDIAVPQELSIVGFDDIPVAEYLWPPLTTVRQDFGRIGAELVRMVLERLRGGDDALARHVVVPTTFVIRASTAGYTPRTRAPRS
ncbi:MAG: LacI family DNA-binding transcriptional regulator [Actinobacteria bacterium]|nr:LacI family DNA-binding transcriptional regulator [Actinomycetota bacterium]